MTIYDIQVFMTTDLKVIPVLRRAFEKIKQRILDVLNSQGNGDTL